MTILQLPDVLAEEHDSLISFPLEKTPPIEEIVFLGPSFLA